MYKSIFFLVCLFLAGCATPEKLICRTWKVDNVDFDAPRSDFDAKIQKSVKELVPTLSFTFKMDSTYKGGKRDEPTTGKWWFTNKKKGMIMTSDKEETNCKIITLTKTKLIIDNTGPQGNKIKFVLSPATTTK